MQGLDHMNPNWWLNRDHIIQEHNGVDVLRDDLLDGGSKSRFLPFLIYDYDHIVFGGPFCGGAPYALSVLGKHSKKQITLFYAKRKKHHHRQIAALQNGSKIIEVPMGFMTNVQKKARDYAADHNALFLPLGFDVPEAEEPFVSFMKKLKTKYYDQIWCCSGSGMLTRCLSKAFPDSEIHSVIVGLKSRNTKQNYGDNVITYDYHLPFQKQTKYEAPFKSCGNYDRKAWEICMKESKGKVLFWNVL